jgi:hypothetical protein
MRTKTIKYIHLSVLAIGFVIGFGFVPEVRTEFHEIVSAMITESDSGTDRVPAPTEYKPRPFAIITKNEKKWKF